MTHLVCPFACTAGHFVRLFIQGWLAAPLTSFICSVFVRLVPRDSNPGWGDWRRSFGLFLFVGFVYEQIEVSAIVFLATGLDAVQRLEQKQG